MNNLTIFFIVLFCLLTSCAQNKKSEQLSLSIDAMSNRSDTLSNSNAALDSGRETVSQECYEMMDDIFNLTYKYHMDNRDSIASAIDQLSDVILKCKSYSIAKIHRGKLYHIIGSTEKAIGEFEHLIEEEPKHSLAYIYLGLMYEANGDSIKADATFRKLISIAREKHEQSNSLEDHLSVLTLRMFTNSKQEVLMSLDSLLYLYPDEDTLINLARTGVIFFDKERYLGTEDSK